MNYEPLRRATDATSAMSEERLEKVFQNTETEAFCICRFLR